MLVQEMKGSSVWLGIQGLVFILPSPLQMQHHKTWFPSPFLAPLFFLMTRIAGPWVYLYLCISWSFFYMLWFRTGTLFFFSAFVDSGATMSLPMPGPPSNVGQAILLMQYCRWGVWISGNIFLSVCFFQQWSVSYLWRMKSLPRLWLSCILLKVSFLPTFQILT